MGASLPRLAAPIGMTLAAFGHIGSTGIHVGLDGPVPLLFIMTSLPVELLIQIQTAPDVPEKRIRRST
jgi:hypothetical protein